MEEYNGEQSDTLEYVQQIVGTPNHSIPHQDKRPFCVQAERQMILILQFLLRETNIIQIVR